MSGTITLYFVSLQTNSVIKVTLIKLPTTKEQVRMVFYHSFSIKHVTKENTVLPLFGSTFIVAFGKYEIDERIEDNMKYF